jgi:DNA-binding transcriptional LysR family regulator
VAVADTGGVTRAATKLHLTQSAVSMQIKRMETALDLPLLKRVGRNVMLTKEGEQLLAYSRRMISLNDEVWGRLTQPNFEGEIKFGFPYDVVYPYIPRILRQFSAVYPRVKMRLKSWDTLTLKARFAAGVTDIVLTTELPHEGKGELLRTEKLGWFSARDGKVWRQSPLQVSFDGKCIFRQSGIAALNAAGMAWEQAVDTTGTAAYSAFVSADIAVACVLQGTQMDDWEEVPAEAKLPELPEYGIFLYVQPGHNNPIINEFADLVRTTYRS